VLPQPLGPIGLPACRLWIGPAGTLLVAHPGTAQNISIGIPGNPALAGLVVGMQALVLDVAVPSGLGAVSNGAVLRLY
jgi:hypothetical protein